MKLAALALIAMALPGAAYAQDQQATEAKPVKAKKICRRDATTGTRVAKQTCRTADEWAQLDGAKADEAGQALERQRMRPN
jgi:hypothetical protein